MKKVKQYQQILGLDPLKQFLVNRDIPIEEVDDYVAASFDMIAEPELLGKDRLKRGVEIIAEAIKTEQDIFIVVDKY